ncbi:MAG: hypothetical protein J7500_09920 [Sphingomonas sp.]|uniref:hypothetical protein n=1 Tax=Sphingomonas sp. TaxID=28214 RepID=UPI001B002F11|nr:hypothetical protein [Sphingomonas sp.]MBO9623014.1 hypothetical protein [Sphingomonas sp.]
MADLREHHRRILELLDELEALTAQSTPDESALAALRYKLSRASGARRKLIETLCACFESELPAASVQPVRALRASVGRVMTHSAEHVGSWGMHDIVRDWSGYCHASFNMRRAMREQINRERMVLYPLIDAVDATP